VIGLSAHVRHDDPVRGFWRSIGALCCAVLLASCSVLSGRSTNEPSRTVAPHSTGASARHTERAAFTDDHAVSALLTAAQHDFETVYTYDYRHLTKYLDAGLNVTTSPYSDTYRSAFEGRAAQALQAGQYVQLATARLAGLASLSGDHTQGSVIVSGTFATTSVRDPNGANKTVTVGLTMKKVGSSWRISEVKNGGATTGSVPANTPLRNAIDAARTALTRIYGLHRAGFKSDYAKALALTTDTLHDTMSQREDAVRTTLTSGQYDLSCKVVGLGVLEPGTDVSLIMVVDEFHVGRQGAELGPYRHILAVSVTDVNGSWRVRSAAPIT
jgi:hypothetical protein